MNLYAKMIHAVIEYDRKKSSRRDYNRYALPQYLRAVHRIEELMIGGTPNREAILQCFTGRLATAVLKSIGEHALTPEEARS